MPNMGGQNGGGESNGDPVNPHGCCTPNGFAAARIRIRFSRTSRFPTIGGSSILAAPRSLTFRSKAKRQEEEVWETRQLKMQIKFNL